MRKSDIASLKQEGEIREYIQFGPGTVFSFALMTKEVDAIEATFDGQSISVLLPIAQANAWMNSQDVGMEKHQVLGEGDSLHILIEKDFPCQDRENEDKSDTFFELIPDQPDVC